MQQKHHFETGGVGGENEDKIKKQKGGKQQN